MILKILQAGNQTLRDRAKPVSPEQLASSEIQLLIDLMIDTLHDAPGVGLAAPQVGESLQIIVIHDKEEYHDIVSPDVLEEQQREPVPPTVIINPVITNRSKQQRTYFEGCLSIEGYLGAVSRSDSVTVTGLDRDGNELTIDANGWFARIIQHEVDHLQGTLYIDSMLSRSFMNQKNFSLHWRKALEKDIKKIFEQ